MMRLTINRNLNGELDHGMIARKAIESFPPKSAFDREMNAFSAGKYGGKR